MLIGRRHVAYVVVPLLAVIFLGSAACSAFAGVPYIVGEHGQRYYLGAIPPDPATIDPARVMSRSQLARARSIHISAAADNSAGLPPVGNQGGQGSCTCWASGYYMKTYQAKQDDPALNITVSSGQVSPAFLYNQINWGYDSGSAIYMAMDLMAGKGACMLSDMPYNDTDCTTFPNRTQFEAALPQRAQTGGLFLFLGQGMCGDDELAAMKAYLDAGGVFVLGVPVYNGWATPASPQYLLDTPAFGEEVVGYHAICVCGYDDAKQDNDGVVRGGFKFVNSWGTGWGDSGYAWLSYDFMRYYAELACYMTDWPDYVPTHAAWIEIDHPNRSDLHVAVGATGIPASYTDVFHICTGQGQPNYHGMADLTSASAYLPPSVECQEWFVEASDGGRHNIGTIESLEIFQVGGPGSWATTASAVTIPDEVSTPVYMYLFAGLAPDIDVSQTTLDLGTITGLTTDNTTIQVDNLGGYGCDWTLDESVSWLTVTPMGGSLAAHGSQQLTIEVDPVGLSAGSPYHYSGTFTVTRTGAPSDTATVTVEFDYPPDLEVNSNNVDLGGITHETTDTSVYVYNTGGDTLDWTMTEAVSWLTVTPGSGTGLASGAQTGLTITVDPAGLTDGVHYSDTFQVARDGAPADTETVTVEFTYYATLDVPSRYSTIQDAIDRSADGDTINVSAGTYNENINFHGKDVDVQSTSGPFTTIIDGGDAGPVVTFDTGETNAAALRGFTIQNGSADKGGGVFIQDASPIVEENLIKENGAISDGGGVYVQGGSPWLTSNWLFDNTATSGAGICLQDATATLSNNLVYGNDAALGGGICSVSSSFTMNGGEVYGNTANAKGGGLFTVFTSSPTIRNVLVRDNTATTSGGGIYCGTACALNLANATVVANGAGSGGGIYVENTTPTINSSIVAFNTSGKGIFCMGAIPTVRYCNVHDNTGGEYDGIADPTGLNGNINADPLFYNPGVNDYHLRSREGRWDPTTTSWVKDAVTSPSIDGGDPALTDPPTGGADALIEPAPNGDLLNQGAYGNTAEASKTPCTVSITAGPRGNPNPVDSRGDVQCSVTANDSNGHALAYLWTARDGAGDPAGSFDDANLANPVWTAPTNSGQAVVEYTITVDVQCADGGTASGSYTQHVAPVADQVIITDGPSGTPNPVASEGQVNCTVAAEDTQGHALTYEWQATGGTFNDTTSQTPTWTAPQNPGPGDATYTLTVTATCQASKTDTASFDVIVEPEGHSLRITAGPSGAPNPSNQADQVQCAVTVTDSDPHTFTYQWEARNSFAQLAGTFDDNTLQNPVWTPPDIVADQIVEFTISVTVTCSGGLVRTGSYTQRVKPQPPAMPSNLVAVAGPGNASVILTWTDNSYNEEGFAIRRRAMHADGSWSEGDWQTIIWLPQNTTTYTDTAVSAPNTYQYQVRSYNGAWPSNWTTSAKVGLVTEPPPMPTGLAAEVHSNPGVVLTWQDNSTTEAGFTLQRRTRQSDGSWPDAYTTLATLRPNTTTYTDGTVGGLKEYQYRVRAFNSLGPSNWAPPVRVLTPAAPPHAPSNVTATVTPESKIQVNWQDNSDDETGFTVQRRSPRADGSWSDSDWVNVVTLGPDATGHLDGTVAAGPVYQYRVRAFNATGTSAWAMSANVAIVTTAPNAPSGLAAQFAGDNGVQLTWTDESEDEMGFQVQRRKRNGDGTWPAAYTALADAGPNMETYADQSATTNGYYQYRVRAHNTVGLSNWVEVKVWVTHTAPTAPSDLVATSVNSGADVSLAWTDNSGNETGFTVQRRKRTGAGTWSAWTTIQTTGPNVSTYTDEDVPGDGEYQYQVNAFNSVGPSAWAGPASIWRLTSKPADPTDFAPTVAAANQVQLTWTDNATNNQGYLLQRRTRNVDSSWPTAFEEIAWIADPYADEYLDDTVETGREYQYRLRAYNAVGPSNWAYVRINVLAVATATVGAVNAQQLNSQYVSVVYSLSAAADVCIEVRNIAGRLIATIPCGVGSAGVNTATWNLRNSSGAPVPSGTYLCIVTAHSERGGQARAVRTLSVRR